jgi:hypothetical protein
MTKVGIKLRYNDGMVENKFFEFKRSPEMSKKRSK